MRRAAPEFLVIVAQDHAELFPRIRRQFLDDPRVQVIIDRRQGERDRRTRPQPAADQRRAPDYWEDLRHHPVVLIPTDRPAPVNSGARASPTGPTPGALEVTRGVTSIRQEIDLLWRWVRTGQKLLARMASVLRDLEERETRVR
jgi:hypothetical protein